MSSNKTLKIEKIEKKFIHKFLKIQVFKTQNLVKKMMKTLNSMKKFINKLFGNVKIFNIFR